MDPADVPEVVEAEIVEQPIPEFQLLIEPDQLRPEVRVYLVTMEGERLALMRFDAQIFAMLMHGHQQADPRQNGGLIVP